MSNKIVLFDRDDQCSGCGACADICHQKAITMHENEYGFRYPAIDEDKCVRCGMCQKVCGFQNINETKKPMSVLAATAKNEEILLKSSSGGVFAELAKKVLNEGGVVFGATMVFKDGVPVVKHIKIESEEELALLQGSKYVQSDCQGVYGLVKQELNAGRTVLFSGTPCQVASVKRFAKTWYVEKKIILVDIICHGVPGLKMFQDYLVLEEENVKGKISEFRFRDKSTGWGVKGRITYSYKKKKKYKPVQRQLSSYYSYFLAGEIFRDSCYVCPFACRERVSDLTIGDYWKFGDEHPEYLKHNGGSLEEEKGISCILVNTEQGSSFLSECLSAFEICESTFDQVAKVNLQLKHPSKLPASRAKIMEMYRDFGYKIINDAYFKKLGKRKYVYMLWNVLPLKIRSSIKRFTRE